MGKRISHIPQDTVEAFTSYSWPGNVREIQNLIERAVIRADNGTKMKKLGISRPVRENDVEELNEDSEREQWWRPAAG
jgi:transcriptional regulator with AAA-type ATPase domain